MTSARVSSSGIRCERFGNGTETSKSFSPSTCWHKKAHGVQMLPARGAGERALDGQVLEVVFDLRGAEAHRGSPVVAGQTCHRSQASLVGADRIATRTHGIEHLQRSLAHRSSPLARTPQPGSSRSVGDGLPKNGGRRGGAAKRFSSTTQAHRGRRSRPPVQRLVMRLPQCVPRNKPSILRSSSISGQ